jgi:glycosyltransferase involved in cell wall biosynthesis
MDNTVLISIIVPSFNSVDYLERTLNSLTCQTHSNWEAIIVDDGSDDGTLDILSDYQTNDTRFKIVRRDVPLKGASVCRNIGIKNAKGDFMIFLDADDLLAPTCLESRLQIAAMHPTYDFWVFSTLLFENAPFDTNILVNVPTIDDTLERFLRMDVAWLSTGPFWKADIIRKLNGWDENLQSGQDWELSVRALIYDLRFRHFSQVDNFWRIKGAVNKISDNNKTKIHLQGRLYLFDKIQGLLINAGKLNPKTSFYLTNLFLSLSLIFIDNGMKNESWLAFKNALSALSTKRKIVKGAWYFLFYIGIFSKKRKTGFMLKATDKNAITLKKVLYN